MGFKIRHWTWYVYEADKPIAHSEDDLMWSAAPKCPKCGAKTEWEVFQTGQDPVGNDEYGGYFSCHPCALHTRIVEVDMRDYIQDELGFTE